MHGLFLQVMREVGWVIFDEIHYMRDPGTVFWGGGECAKPAFNKTAAL